MTHFSFVKKQKEQSDILVVPVYSERSTGDVAHKANDMLYGTLDHALTTDQNFKGKAGQVLAMPSPVGSVYKKIILLGLGAREGMDSLRAETLGSRLHAAVAATGLNNVTVWANDFKGADAALAADIANGFLLKSYRFDKHKSGAAAAKDYNVALVQADPQAAQDRFDQLAPVSRGAFFARDLANEPPNVMTPQEMVVRVAQNLPSLGVEVVDVLNENDLKAKGMGAYYAVGQGSNPDKAARMIVLRYNGTGYPDSQPLALVGKGLTFDTGGLSLKSNMSNMKFDMSGAATVAGTMAALAGRKARVHVVAVLGMARNDIGPGAYCVDDIVTAMNGKTIDIQNTDAEGRLVLADCLTYTQRTFKPHTVIDLATLTGACKAALGSTMCGVFANDEKLSKDIQSSGGKVGERSWPLPLGSEFSDAIKGTYSDLVNIGMGGAGASTAAAFLQEFIEGQTKWAHLDIAGVANGMFGHATLPDKIGTGFGVRLLNQLILDHYEAKQWPRPVSAAHIKPAA